MTRTHTLKYFVKKTEASPFEVSHESAKELNEQGYDVYWCYNGIGQARRKEFLEKIYAFYVDVDCDDKAKYVDTVLRNLKLKPSTLIETIGGFHMYWDLKDPIDTTMNPVGWSDLFREFIKNRILPLTDGDPNACDAVRLLRVPMMKYWKDGSGDEVFLHYGNEAEYTLYEIKEAFPEILKKEAPMPSVASNKVEEDKFVWSKPVMDWLILLSGSPDVRGETYTFKKENYMNVDVRIYVNGKRSNAWIDKDGKIGSTDNAAPSILQWLMWYGHSKDKSYDIMRSLNAPQSSR